MTHPTIRSLPPPQLKELSRQLTRLLGSQNQQAYALGIGRHYILQLAKGVQPHRLLLEAILDCPKCRELAPLVREIAALPQSITEESRNTPTPPPPLPPSPSLVKPLDHTAREVGEILRDRRPRALRDEEWVELARGQLAALELERTDLLEAFTDLDRLAASPAYQAVAARLSSVWDGARHFLLEPDAARLAAFTRLRSDLEELTADARQRAILTAHSVRVKSSKEALLVQAQALRVMEKTQLRDKDLCELPVWEASATAICNALRPDLALRTAVISALGAAEGVLARDLQTALSRVRHLAFPCVSYRDDPSGFMRDVLGFEPWEGQCRISEAVRDYKYVAVSTGNKTGKSRIASGLAIWWYCVWPDGKVLFTNATGKQLANINWPELVVLHEHSGVCLPCREASEYPEAPCPHSQCVDGRLYKTYSGGLVSEDLARKVVGCTSQEKEGIQGFSGAHLLVIVDEASALEQDVYEAWMGNVAAKDARILMIGNPTRTEGPFYNAFHKGQARWALIRISSLEAAAEAERRALAGKPVPGLASLEWCNSVEEEDPRGKESAFYRVRVLGEFPTADTAAIYPMSVILAATDPERWRDTPFEGPLLIALDPAGESGLGDLSVFSVGRGFKVEVQRSGRGWSADAHTAVLEDLLALYRQGPERVIVAIDGDGVGAEVKRAFDAFAEKHWGVETIAVHFGAYARNRNRYDLVADEAHAITSQWLAAGGAVPRHPKLEQDLEGHLWTEVVRRDSAGRRTPLQAATSKADFRKIYHRSPDHLESLRVYCWASYLRDLFRPAYGSAPAPEPVATDGNSGAGDEALVISTGRFRFRTPGLTCR